MHCMFYSIYILLIAGDGESLETFTKYMFIIFRLSAATVSAHMEQNTSCYESLGVMLSV